MLWLSLRVAGLATAFALALGPWPAWLLARRQFSGKQAVGTAVLAALVLPPPIVCYYFLCALGGFGTFTWKGAVAAAALSAVPLLVWAARAAFTSLDPAYGNAARSLGSSDWRVFWRVELPLAYRPILGATAFAFVRALTECAATLAIAGRLKL
jgi:molybdate transport system permease protein